MRKITFLLVLLLVTSIFSGDTLSKKSMREISFEEKEGLVQYLKTHWKTPEEYVAEKFSNYDIVFIGEYHRIKHDVELIHRLIPYLYKAGVYNLGIEFGAYEYQDKIDVLITADKYDEDLARWLMFKFSSFWGYKEYIDIYRKAWELNKSLSKNSPKFRVVNLNYIPNWSVLKKEMTPELWKKVWHKGNSDEHMAKVIIKEFIDKGQKALIYLGSHHAFTRYCQPIYNFENKKFKGFSKSRTENIIHNKINGKVFNIFLHSSWSTRKSFLEHNYLVGGVIDGVMKEFKDKRVGFDAKESPFGKLLDDTTYYSIGYEDFSLDTFCDGYIFQKHFSDYEGCTVDNTFITRENVKEAIETLPNLRVRRLLRFMNYFRFIIKLEDFLLKAMQDDANMKRRFRDLE